MKLQTAQMSKWRTAEGFLDISRKSGDDKFAPSKGLLYAYKNSEINDEQYTEYYYAEMRVSYFNNKEHWLEVCNRDLVTIGCYCPANNFCHRYLLRDMFSKVCAANNIEFEYLGELE